jgi:dipeptidyl-peptidase-4
VTTPDEGPQPFLRQRARTRHFSVGAPRSFRVDPTGSRVLFLRSPSGDNPVTQLWMYDVATGADVLLADPAALVDPHEDLPPAERARRERMREIGSGIVAFATDDRHEVVAFALSSQLFVVDVVGRTVSHLAAAGAVVDPRPDPTGRRIAYVAEGAVRVVDRDGHDQPVTTEVAPAITWGLADFIAAEEMHRQRGHWWTRDGERLLLARVDERPVALWHISDPANPEREATVVRFPRAGTDNADVSLHVFDLKGGHLAVDWDRSALPYLADVQPTANGAVVVVQSRDQKLLQTLDVDLATGKTSVAHEQTDDLWLDLVQGAPARLGDGRLVTTVDLDDTRRLCVDGEPVSPAGWQVGAVDVGDADVLFSATDDPTQRHIWLLDESGKAKRLTSEPGVHAAARGGGLVVIASASMDHHGTRVTLQRDGQVVGEIASYAEEPLLTPSVTFLTTGRRELRSAVLLPSGHERGVRLPVLLDPYGGPLPEMGRVVRSRTSHLVAQWLADQGFAVVITDGRGMPGRGPAWTRAIHDDWAGVVLEDQVDALHAVAETVPDMDLDRVGIRGWSFGGYLAALAVLRRPDVFHAAVAGAPVTDWTLYDTHYTERYLGDPRDNAERYAAASLIDDAPKLQRPLLLIHGLADDNVVAAHTLRLSAALLAAGRQHAVLPLPGVTHMASAQPIEQSLLMVQLDFLRDALNHAPSPG